MAPTKNFMKPTLKSIAASTRTKISLKTTNIIARQPLRTKRKADASPEKLAVPKRPALGEITNVTTESTGNLKRPKIIVVHPVKKVTVVVKHLPSVKTAIRPKHNENIVPPRAPVVVPKVQTRAAIRSNNSVQTAIKPKEPVKEKEVLKVRQRLSNEFEKTEESLYSTALEELSTDGSTHNAEARRTRSQSSSAEASRHHSVSFVAKQLELQLNLGDHNVPDGINDFDKENWNDVYQVSHYTMDIFNYLKLREPTYQISDYMGRQASLTNWMRALLVDWMVEIQESFELNHETLYLGIKLVDTYLSKVTVSREILQLVGAASMFVASKYDERIPPYLDDFIYICDGAYTRRDLIKMERNLLKVCDFNLGVPLSYRFLRRYGRCGKISMPVLTLARFILEFSLMEYMTIFLSDSKLAAASLYLAVRMKGVCDWNKTLEFYSGYKLSQIINVVYYLNDILHKPLQDQLMTIHNKYSHKIFHEVAKTPLLNNSDLKV